MKQKEYNDIYFRIQMKDDIGGLREFYNKSLKEKVIYKKRMKQKHFNWLGLSDEEKNNRIQELNQHIKEGFIKHCLKVEIEEGEEILKKAGMIS